MEGKVQYLVVVAGGFDPLHYGHVRHILAAKELGDYLIVIVGTDYHMKLKKGFAFMPFAERVEIIRAIRGVDEVIGSIDKDGSVVKTLQLLQPDIYAKGGDRTPKTMPIKEIEMCKEMKCKIVYGVGGDKIQSSSKLVGKLK
jgi:D-beta-D-heptose 7-phosphate kinase/D-beta-D-heptose 1-phosphate adenosyltransferase